MSLIRKTALSPFWIAGKVIAPIKPERIQGAILGAAALALLTGYVNIQDNRVPLTTEEWQAIVDAQLEGESPWSERVELSALPDDGDYFTPEEADVPIPARKPEFGYTAQDRAELNQLFAEVTK